MPHRVGKLKHFGESAQAAGHEDLAAVEQEAVLHVPAIAPGTLSDKLAECREVFRGGDLIA